MLYARSMRLGPRWIGVLLLFALALPGRALAQRRTTITFESDCAGNPISGAWLAGYEDRSAALYASCGVSSIVTGEANGYQRIAQSGALLGETISGVTGNKALTGAYSSFNPSSLTVDFAYPVHEISLDILDVGQGQQARVRTFNGGAQVSDDAAPTPVNGKSTWSRASSTPVTRLVVSSSQPGGILPTVDRWFIDQLSFNAWVCGDGEIDNQNGGTETCDDANTAQCDGCSTTCTASVSGCWNGTTCVAAGTNDGCLSCNMSTPAGPTGDVPTTVQPVGTTCDDGLRCTQSDACDAAGRCLGSARSCDDALACTSDTCSEAAPGDGCTHALDPHGCLIGGSCFSELGLNPSNPCLVCDPTRASSAWSAVANTVRCAPPSCIGDQFTAAGLCDGAGACPAVAPTSCGNFVCATSTSCTDSCSDDRECGTSSHCDQVSKKCVDNRPLGAACTSNGECASGFACADGVCCESACGSRCETCNAPGFVGKCINITFGDPENECPDGTSCRSGNQCVPDPPPMEPAPVIDAGMSMMPSTVLPIGAACDQDQKCGLGFCRDGVCCASACDGACEGCNVLGASPGQCVAYSLGNDPENECSGVGGVCNGANACAYYETRGSGSCALGSSESAQGLWVALALLLSRRRRAT
jgi:hypothetical protein